jgi:hypothetical protein
MNAIDIRRRSDHNVSQVAHSTCSIQLHIVLSGVSMMRKRHENVMSIVMNGK